MAIGDPITQPIPPVSTAGTTYASQLVAFNQEVKARLEAQVPLTSLLPGTFDLDNNPVTNTQYVELYEQTDAPSTPVGSIQNYQGNLWYVSAAGAAQITSGNSLNAASLGGIDGDYGGGNPASLRFTDADKTFYFYDDFAGGEWAHVDGLSFNIHGGATEDDRVRLAWAGVNSYTLTLPEDPPAVSGTLLQMDTLGAVTVANTGLDSISLVANENITISGTGELKHGDRKIVVPVVYPNFVTELGSISNNGSQVGSSHAASSTAVYPLYGLQVGDRIKSVEIRLSLPAANAITYTLVTSGEGNLAAFTAEGSTSSASASVTLTPTPLTLVANGSDTLFPWLRVAVPAATVCAVLWFVVTYDRP